MSAPRLKTALQVSALLRASDRQGRPGMVLRKGDPDSGSVLVVLRSHAGLAALSRAHDGDGVSCWMRATGPEPMAQPELDVWLDRRLGYDPDLWIVEIEVPSLSPPLPDELLAWN